MLQWCSLTPACGPDFAAMLARCPKLVRLCVAANPLLGAVMDSLGTIDLSGLRILDLTLCGLTDAAPVAELAATTTQLEEAILQENHLRLGAKINACKVNVSDCHLTGKAGALVIARVSQAVQEVSLPSEARPFANFRP